MRYHVVLKCAGVPTNLGKQGAEDITENFKQRTWHENVICSWDGSSLILSAFNDYDKQGKALMDEFSDEISACISGGFDGDIQVISVTQE